jgi:hypothetical protein
LQSYDKFILFYEDLCLLAAPSFVRSSKISKARDVLRQQIVGSVTRPTDWPGWLNEAGLRGEHIRASFQGSSPLSMKIPGSRKNSHLARMTSFG